MTTINAYLIPLCFLLLAYTVWTLYREKRSFTYKPFLLGLFGSILIVLDNFVLGEQYNTHNVPSWVGNASLIVGVIWASRDMSKEQTPFGF